jgi:hypothetical protein
MLTSACAPSAPHEFLIGTRRDTLTKTALILLDFSGCNGALVKPAGDRIEAFKRIIGRVFVKRRRDCERGCAAEQQHIAVRFRTGGEFGPECAAGARPIIDDDKAETRRQVPRD